MSIFYHSTRSNEQLVTSKQAILRGIAPDGGLYVRDGLSDLGIDLDQVCSQDFRATSRLVLGKLLPDYTEDEIASCVEGAYGEQWDCNAVTPVTKLGDDWLLELYHGPTCAFKDVALQMLPRLMSCARTGDGRDVMIVTATSGDTGKAALAGFAGVPGTAITVFYPHGKVSDTQRLQMVTQAGANVEVCAVEGNFDDVQTQVKHIFADDALAGRLAAENTVLSSANSINVGRLVPQVVYYFDAYAQLVRAGAIEKGDEVEFCVPTGNFGDVLAGYYAKLMGLPVRAFVVASNTNDVLCDFIATGTYDRMRPFHKTISPSMDILVSSNLERLLYLMSDGDCELVAHLMSDLADKGSYTVPDALLARLRETFACGRADDAQTKATIRGTWEELGVVLDTHTAVAKHVLDSRERDGVAARVCLSTASPFKFSSDVLAALGTDVSGMGDFDCMDELARTCGVAAPAQLSSLRDAEVLHTGVTKVDGMSGVVEAACGRCLA